MPWGATAWNPAGTETHRIDSIGMLPGSSTSGTGVGGGGTAVTLRQQLEAHHGSLPDPRSFTIGPIEFLENETVTVKTFVDKINAAFLNAFSTGDAPRRYFIEARVAGTREARGLGHRIGGSPFVVSPRSDLDQVGVYGFADTDLDPVLSSPGSQQAVYGIGGPDPGVTTVSFEYEPNISAILQGRNNQELVIEYRIFNVDVVRFKILFNSGPHGFTGAASETVHNPPFAEVVVVNKPSIKSIELPYCTLSTMITDKPPTPPNIEFIPYAGINNKVLILLNSGAGERTEYPVLMNPPVYDSNDILIDQGDVSFIEAEYLSQHGLTSVGMDFSDPAYRQVFPPLQYKNDDFIRKYDLFRINQKPTGYQNFANSQIASLEEDIGPNKSSTAISHIDTILPNKKYWYCARSVDIHDNISNPTCIFEIEIIDNRGQMFMTVKPLYIDAPKLNYSKSGRRLLAIRPRPSQTIYDQGSDQAANLNIGDMDQPPSSGILGNADDSIWEKIFKIRVTSKKTGKKIDLNVTFKNDGVVTP